MLHAHVKDCAFVCRPWSSFNDAALHDQRAAQNRLLRRGKTCPAQPALHELESIKMTVTCDLPGIPWWLANKASRTCTLSLVLQLAVCLLMLGNGASTFAQASDTGIIKFWLFR